MSGVTDLIHYLLAKYPTKVTVLGKRSEHAIKGVEAALGIKFPEDYREFLQRFGLLAMGSIEIYGVFDDRLDDRSAQDGARMTIEERVYGLPTHLFVLYSHDGDQLDCLDCSQEDSPVVAWDNIDKQIIRRLAPSFLQYLEARAARFGELEGA